MFAKKCIKIKLIGLVSPYICQEISVAELMITAVELESTAGESKILIITGVYTLINFEVTASKHGFYFAIDTPSNTS